jgi:sugar phosphate permease
LSSIVPGWIVGQGWQFFGLLPWRSAFVACGAIGPVVAALLLVMKEPPRRQAVGEPDLLHLGEKLSWLFARRRRIVPLFGGFCLFYLALVGITAWTAAFLTRRYGVALPQFSAMLGAMLFISGMGGYLLSGIIVDSKLGRGPRGKLAILTALPLLALPSAFATFAPTPASAIMILSAIGLAMPAVNIATNAAIQDLMPNTLRGFTHTLLGLCSAIVAGALGPWLMATITTDLGQAFIIVGVPALIASCLSFAFALRTLETSS